MMDLSQAQRQREAWIRTLDWRAAEHSRNWQLIEPDSGRVKRLIAVREADTNEPGGPTRYQVSGGNAYDSLDEAKDAAIASLRKVQTDDEDD